MIDTSKVIHAPVGGGRYTVTAPIVKEDYGLYLKIEGLELPSTYEVDFSNSEHNGTSVTMIGNADGVLIPHQFIDTGKDVFAFLYHVGEDYGRTIFKFRIPNKLRPDRTDEQPTPEEQSVIDQAISALNSAVEQTAQDVASAQGYAQASASNAESASASAQSADASRVAADESEYNAQVYAENAQASATASAQSASQSAQIKTDVEDMVDDAQASARASAQSATASANSASQASASATSASQNATSAQGYASQAQTSAQTASTKASEASTSASTASTKASESAQSATNASQSAQTAEQAKTASQTAQGLAESARDSAVSAKTDAESARDEAQNLVDGISGKVEQIDSNTNRIASLEEDRYKPYVVDSASGSIASFSDGADDIPLKSLVVDINPVQDLHGYDSPWVAGGGKNKIPFPYYTQDGTINGITFSSDSDGKIKASGTSTTGTNFFLARDINLQAGTYTASYSGTLDGIKLYVRDVTNNVVLTELSTATATARTFTISSAIDARVYINISNASTVVSVSAYIQLESGSAATTYAPYENICPISGWTEANVNASGKNLVDISRFATEYPNYCSFSDGVLTVASNNSVLYSRGINVDIPQGSVLNWTITDGTSVNARLRIAYEDGAVRSHSSPIPLTVSKRITALRFDWGTSGTFTVSNFQAEFGSTATPYEPYTGRSITINLGQTVYGGKLDVLSGVLTVDRKQIVFDGTQPIGNVNWRPLANSVGWLYAPSVTEGILNKTLLNADVESYGMTCDSLPVYPYSGTNTIYSTDTPAISVVGSNAYAIVMRVNDTSLTTDTAINAYLAEHPITVVYPLATPIEIQLDTHAINSLYGQNNIFADTGDSHVEYRADTRLYIEKLTQPEEDDMIADSAITSGQFFMVGNSLYRALANIASGATITVGTNAQRVSLSDALNLVNA